MDEERDIVVFTDDEGNDLELEVLDYVFYNGEEFAVLTGIDDEGCDCEGCDHDHEHGEDCECEQELYIMKVVQLDDDMEEFVPIEDESLMDALIEIVQKNFEDAEGEDEE